MTSGIHSHPGHSPASFAFAAPRSSLSFQTIIKNSSKSFLSLPRSFAMMRRWSGDHFVQSSHLHLSFFIDLVQFDQWPNKAPEPTAVGAVSSAIAVHVASRRWLSFLR